MPLQVPAYRLAAEAGGVAGAPLSLFMPPGVVVDVPGPAPGAPLVIGSSWRLQPAPNTVVAAIKAKDKVVMRFMVTPEG